MGTKVGGAYIEMRSDNKKLPKDLKETENLVEKSTDKIEKNTKASFKRIGAAIATAYATIKSAAFIKDTALVAARFETLGVVMTQVGKNANYASGTMKRFDEDLRKTGISMIESRNSLAKMAQAQLDLNKASELGRIAQNAAVIGNINSSEAFGRMIRGIQSGQTEILKTIGINVNFATSYRLAAKAAGKAVGSLTELEKTIIRQNAVLKFGTRIAGTYEAAMSTAGKKLSSFTRHVDDFKVKMGKAFGPALVILVDKATEAMKAFSAEIVKPEVQQQLKDMALNVSTLAKSILDLSVAVSKGASLRSVTNTFGQGVKLANQGLLDLDTFTQASFRQRQTMVDTILKQQKKMIKGMQTIRGGSLSQIKGKREEAFPTESPVFESDVGSSDAMGAGLNLVDLDTYRKSQKGVTAILADESKKRNDLLLKRNNDQRQHIVDMADLRAKTSKQNLLNTRQEAMATAQIYSNLAGNAASTFKALSDRGGAHAKANFDNYKVLAIAQAAISTSLAVVNAYGNPLLPFPANVVVAGTIGALGAVQMGLISAQRYTPPSFDSGGVSNAKGVYQTGNIQEAHVPIPSGKIPVKLEGGGSGGKIQIVMNNPVFQDIETQKRAFAQIAEAITRQVAPGAIVEDFNNDGAVRNIIRQGG